MVRRADRPGTGRSGTPARPSWLGLFALISASAVLPGRASAQVPFFVEETPAPRDVSWLYDVDADSSGRLVAVGTAREYHVGGSPFFPLVLVKDGPELPWTVLEPPDLGSYYHELNWVGFVPGTDGDFVTVGGYYPDDSIAHPHGMLLRYRRSSQEWELRTFMDPGYEYLVVEDAAFDPEDPKRLLIVGTRASEYGGGACFEFNTLVVDYRLEAQTYAILPTTRRGVLRTIVPLPNGNFLTAGIAAGDCDVLPFPVVLEVEQGVEIVHPNPPPRTPYYWYSLNGACPLGDGRIFFVGRESPYGGSQSRTLSYRYHPTLRVYEFFKPLDPDQNGEYQNLLFDVERVPDGRLFAVGRITYYYDGWRYAAMVQSFDGQNWILQPLPDDFMLGVNSQLWGLAVAPGGEVIAAGFYRNYGIWDDQTLILRSGQPAGASREAPTTAGFEPLRVASPSPVRGPVALDLRLTRGGTVRVEVFDVAGFLVRSLLDEVVPAGGRTVWWDGHDANGRPSPSGVYFVRLASPDGGAAARVLRLR